jgi:hypothetical protein
MKSKIIINSCISLFFGIATLSVLNGCQTTDIKDNGLVNKTVLDPSFTITPVSGINTYLLKGSDNLISSKWYLDKGSNEAIGKTSQLVSFPDKGIYNIIHTAIGVGGEQKSETKTLTIDAADPVGGNLIVGGQFKDASDFSKWKRLIYFGDDGNPVQNARWTFFPKKSPTKPGGATLTSKNWEQQGLYQIINVVAGVEYQVEMAVSGEEASVNTWFEVYADAAAPAIFKKNDDYTAGGAKLKLTTWCGGLKGKFSGDLTALDCDTQLHPTRKLKGIIKFATSGPIYFIIRSGGEKVGDSGITIQNVQVRGLAPL